MLIYIAYVYSQFQVACPITKKNKNPNSGALRHGMQLVELPVIVTHPLCT